MAVSTLTGYLSAVGRHLKTWTGAGLRALPGFPSRSDMETLAKTVWFRGHHEAKWRLIPAVYRLPGYSYKHEVELNVAFMARSFLLPGLPPRADLPAWLSAMQHHGHPTRLLDWTDSALVGLFFALEGRFDYFRTNRMRQFRPVVWMVNPHALNWVSTGGSIIPSTDLNEAAGNDRDGWTPRWGCSNVFPAFGLQERPPFEGPMAVNAPPTDPRMRAQRSRFTVHGIRAEPIEELFRGDPGKDLEQRGFLHRVPIAQGAALRLLEELSRMNVSHSTLFPDIEGAAKESMTLLDWREPS